MKFSVYYSITTPESAEYGDFDESGLIDGDLSLRDALTDLFRTRTNEVSGIEVMHANCLEQNQTGRLECCPSATVYNGMEFRTGASENRSLFPDGPITASSWRRICRIAGF